MKVSSTLPVFPNKKTFVLLSFLLCLSFFLWADATVDPTLALRQLWLAALLFGVPVFLSLKKVPLAIPVPLLRSKILLALGGYLLLCWISIVQATSISVSLFELSKITLFCVLIVFLPGLQALDPKKFRGVLVTGITISSALLVLIGYGEFFYETKFFKIAVQSLGNRVYATFGNRNIFSEMVLLFIPVQVICFFQNADHRIRKAAAALIASSLLLLLLLETRSCWLALAVSSGLVLPLTIKKLMPKALPSPEGEGLGVRSRWPLAVGISLLLLSSCPAYKIISPRVSHTFAQLNEKDSINSLNERLLWWKKTTQMIKEHPLGGVGPGNWMIVLPKYGLSGTHAEQGRLTFRQPHNDYLWIWAESGIFALLLYLLFFASLIITALKIIYGKLFSIHDKIISAASLFGILCYMIISFFGFPKERIEHNLLLALFSVFILSVYYSRVQKENTRKLSLGKAGAFISFCSLVIAAFEMNGEIHARNAETARLKGDRQRSIEEGEKAGNLFFRVTPTGIPVDFFGGMGNFELRNYEAAIPHFQKALSHSPYQVLVLHFLATSHAMLGDEKNAVKYYEQTLAVSGRMEHSKINLALSYFNLGEHECAKDMLLKINDMQVIQNNLRNVRVILSHSDSSLYLPDALLLEEFQRLKNLKR